MTKIEKFRVIYVLLFLLFGFLSYLTWFVSECDPYREDMIYWVKDASKEKVRDAISPYCQTPVYYEPYNSKFGVFTDYMAKQGLHPNRRLTFKIIIDSYEINGALNTDGHIHFINLFSYKKVDSKKTTIFLYQYNLIEALKVACLFEDNVLKGFEHVDKSYCRIYRNIYARCFFHYQFFIAVFMIVLGYIIDRMINRNHQKKVRVP